MTKKILHILSVLCLAALLSALLSACRKSAPNAAAPTAGPGQASPVVQTVAPTPILPPPLTGDVQIQQLLLTSHTRWKSLIANAAITQYPPAGVTAEPEITAVRLWIEQPAKAKVISGPPQGAPTFTFASDGVNSRRLGEAVQPLPPGLSEVFTPPNAPSDTVYLHPLAGMLGTPISDLVFPAGLAQRGGEYRVTGKESFAGREVYVVEWSRIAGELVERTWVDTQTGIILRHQSYGKAGSETPVADMAIHFIQLDTAIAADTFDLDSPDLAALASPEPTLDPNTPQLRIKADLDLVNVRGGPSTDFAVVATLTPKMVVQVTGKNPAEDWFQVDVDGVTGWVFGELVDVSGQASIPVVP